MIKTTKVLLGIFISILILSMISIVSADSYEFSLRNGESDVQALTYSNSNTQTMNVTFQIVNYVTPGTSSYASNDRDGEITFVFDPVSIDNVAVSSSVQTNLTFTVSSDAPLGAYTADVEVNETPAIGGASTTRVIHDVTINVIANIVPTMTQISDFELFVGETQTELITINDFEGDELTFDLTNQPAGMTATLASLSIVNITWSPIVAAASRSVTFSLSDGIDTVSQNFEASAIQEGLHIAVEDVEFGSNSQERETVTSEQFTITNTGSDPITGLNIEAVGISGDYNFTIEVTPASSLLPGASTSFRARVYIPEDQNSGNEDIGTLNINYNSVSQTTETIYLITESLLEINEVEIDVSGDDETVSEGEEIDVDVEDEITLTIEIENVGNEYQFDDGDINVEILIDDLDIEDDMDYDEDLEDGDDTGSDIEFEFDIPSDEDDGIVDAVITVTGEDENGAEHEIIFEFTLNVDRPNHLIKIQDLVFLSSSVKAGRSAELEIDIENVGSNDEDEIYIKIESDALDYVKLIGPFDVEEGDDLTRTVSLSIPSDAETGEYLIQVTTYTDTDDESDIESILLTVTEGTTTTTTPTIPNTPTTTINTSPIAPLPNDAAYGEPIKSGFFGSDTSVLVLLIILIVVMIGVIVVILIPAKK